MGAGAGVGAGKEGEKEKEKESEIGVWGAEYIQSEDATEDGNYEAEVRKIRQTQAHCRDFVKKCLSYQ